MRTLIVDDIRLSRDGLSSLLSSLMPEIQIIGSLGTVREAKSFIESNTLDLIFLDIQLGDGSSFELLDSIHIDTKVVFITAYDEHAIEAIHKGAFDYLLKPLNINELRSCVQRIKEITINGSEPFEESSTTSSDNSIQIAIKKIGVSSTEQIHFVDFCDIIYLKADGKYTEIYTKNGIQISSKNLKIFEHFLSEPNFMRVHHSFFLNLNFIRKFKKDDNLLILDDGTEIPVAKSRKDELMNKLMIV